MRSVRIGLVFAVGLAALAACGTRNVPEREVLYDAGSDGGGADAPGATDGAGGGDSSPYLGGPCVDDGQCDDGIACTYDSCDKSVGRCLDVPDDTQCQDGIYCDGQEKCVPGHGCEP